MIYYHRIGTPQCEYPDIICAIHAYPIHVLAEDILVHSDKENSTWFWSIDISEDGKYFFLYTSKDTSRVSRSVDILTVSFNTLQKNLLWVAEVENNEIGPNIQWNKIQNEFVSEFDVYSYDVLSVLLI